MMKKLFIANLLFSFIFLLIAILSFNGNIHFGHGLGDLFYLIIALCFFLMQITLALAFHFSKIAGAKNLKISFLLFTLVLLFLIYKFTLGRGPESPWDGTIFF